MINEISELDSNKIPLSDIQRKKLNLIIEMFPNSERDGLGCTTLIEHHIDTGNSTPIKQRYYPISPAREKILCKEIDRMLDLGVIEECPSSPWSSPGVLIVKPEKVRFCVDSRKLNSVTVKDAYPIPNIDGIISRLPPVYFISKVDLKDAFWQIKLDETSRPKTAFTIPNRPLYQFTRMPFGLCNAPQSMCRLMDIVIPYNLKTNVFVYLDDLLIVSKDFDEHLEHLHAVAVQLKKAGLTINVKKSSFAIKEIQYLGYVVGGGSMKVDSGKIKAINEFPVPKSIRQLRQFLGMAGWYRRFIDDYATVSFHLTELLSKKKTFHWTEDAQKAFETLKSKLTTAPVLVHADFEKPFIVQCDASTFGVGAVLAQLDKEGNEKPIAFMSQKLNKAQRNYSITELECLAVILAIKKFRAYIEGHEFKVITDHASLKWLMRQKDLSGRLARWALKLQGFNFTIEHRKGKDNVVPDTLSRAFENEKDSYINEIELEVMPMINLESEEFESNEYKSWSDEFGKLKSPDFKVVGKYIYKRTSFDTELTEDNNKWKLLVPTKLRKDVLYSAHNIPTSAHFGIAKTLERIRRYFFWPGLVADVKNYIGKCDSCKTSKTPTMSLKPPLGQMEETQRPFQRLYIDFIGPLPRTKKGNIGIFIVLDHFSKFTFLKPLRKFISKSIVDYLKVEIFDCYGVPEVIVSDNGSQFRCKEFKTFLEKHGVKHVTTALYSPQSNASERVNRSINEALRSYVKESHQSWDIFISSVNCALRNSIHQTIDRTPYEIVFGQIMVTHGEDYCLLKKLNLLRETDNCLLRHDETYILRDSIQAKIKEAFRKNERRYNLRTRKREFSIGEVVIRRNFVHSCLSKKFCSKLAAKGVKAKVIKKIGKFYYELEDCINKNVAVYHVKDIWK